MKLQYSKASLFFSDKQLIPSKRQYVNALAKEVKVERINRKLRKMPKTKPKKRKKPSGRGLF